MTKTRRDQLYSDERKQRAIDLAENFDRCGNWQTEALLIRNLATQC